MAVVEHAGKGYVRADLHNWVRTTNNFKPGDFDKVIDVAHKRLDPGGIIGIVDAFDEVRYGKLYGTAREYKFENNGNFVYVPERGIYLIRGERVYTADGNALVLGLNENERLMNQNEKTTLEYALRKAEEFNGSVVLCNLDSQNKARKYFGNHPEKLKQVVAIEIYNGSNVLGSKPTKPNLSANQEADMFYKRFRTAYSHLGHIKTSGGHSIGEIGRCWTEIPRFKGETSGDMKLYIKEALKPENIGKMYGATSWIPSLVHDAILYFPFFGWMARGAGRRKKIGGIAQ